MRLRGLSAAAAECRPVCNAIRTLSAVRTTNFCVRGTPRTVHTARSNTWFDRYSVPGLASMVALCELSNSVDTFVFHIHCRCFSVNLNLLQVSASEHVSTNIHNPSVMTSSAWYKECSRQSAYVQFLHLRQKSAPNPCVVIVSTTSLRPPRTYFAPRSAHDVCHLVCLPLASCGEDSEVQLEEPSHHLRCLVIVTSCALP